MNTTLTGGSVPTQTPVVVSDRVPYNGDVDMTTEFVAEATEHLESAEQLLLGLEQDPTNRESLNALYRIFHTVKGVAGFLGLNDMKSLTHEAENLLDKAREGRLRLAGPVMDLVFAAADSLRRHVGYVKDWLRQGGGSLTVDPGLPGLVANLKKGAAGELSVTDEIVRNEAPSNSVQNESHAAETVKVDRDRLDKLINVIGELVIAESMIRRDFEHLSDENGSLTRVQKIARELQELSLSLRMVPIRGAFQKMARVVRDLSKQINKQVRLELYGEDTELDKSVVDHIGDPLIHMVRNAMDHGLEPAAERVARGKAEQGRLVLRAYHQGGNICIELEDDGRGLDRDAILRKAIERNLVRETDTLSDHEIYNLVFQPGFSTAKQVTELSGRGVGMDVVRRNVEALQGAALIDSRPGNGATFTMRLPLTLAIMDGLAVAVNNETYILPLLSVIESIRPNQSDVHLIVGSGEVVIVRGDPIPLLRLHRIYGLSNAVENPWEGLVVIVENQNQRLALLVDELVGQQQVVMKSLETNYRKVDGISGATILGDGRVAFIVDILGLTRLAKHTN